MCLELKDRYAIGHIAKLGAGICQHTFVYQVLVNGCL